MQNKRTTRRGGFTLVELIIAAALTSIILSSIAGLFVLALRTVKSGNAAMEANELTRAAFAVLERDLNSAFTSREHGELFHFHGNEVGMSFIGLVRTYNSANTNSDMVELGRVTYVINPTLDAEHNGRDDDGDGVIDNVGENIFDLIFMERLSVVDLNSNGVDDDGDGQTDEGDEFAKEMVEAFLPSELQKRFPLPGVRTVSLLRYFEPGVESLDEYDPGIRAILDTASDPPSLEDGESVLQEQLRITLEALGRDNVRDAQLIDEVTRNFRRDAYIRMLANAQIFNPENRKYPDGWEILERDPRDYVIADNILDIESQVLLAGGDPDPFLLDDIQRFPYFLYGRIRLDASVQNMIDYTATWNANANIIEIRDNPIVLDLITGTVRVDPDIPSGTEWQTFGGIGTPLQARLPEIVRVRFPFVFDSPYVGAPHVQRVLAQDIRVPSAFTRRNPFAGLSGL